MDFKLLFNSIVEACENSPVLIGISALAVCVSLYLIIDAHRNKKNRAGHRWK